MGMKKISLKGLSVDSIPNSLNSHNCMVDSKEDYKWDLGRERVNQDFSGKQSIFVFFFLKK